ncbi:hypothetical protein ACSTIN_22930, partial [Vibrio parahaemolyticus]
EYGVYVIGISLAGILGAIFFSWIKLSVSRYQAMSAEVDFRGAAMVASGSRSRFSVPPRRWSSCSAPT